MKIGQREFETGKTYICGILNLTPDSFSDGGKYQDPDAMLYHVEEMISEGCDLLDLGAESTRPGFRPVSAQEEAERLLPAIEMIRGRFDIPISVDTYKAQTARAALSAGADLINDIRGLHPDPAMLQVIVDAHVPCVLMHDGPAPTSQQAAQELCASADMAQEAGIAADQIILDPGIGFGKTQEENLMLLRDLPVLAGSAYPVLLGASRKSVIGYALGLPVTEREEATITTSVLAVQAGCLFVRVHQVRGNRRAVDMAMAIRDGKQNIRKADENGPDQNQRP